MITPLRNDELDEIFNELENSATDPVELDDSFSKANLIYNDVLDIVKANDDATVNHIITFLNHLKDSYDRRF